MRIPENFFFSKYLILLLSFFILGTHAMDNNKLPIYSYFSFKKLTQSDWPLMLKWFKEAHVEQWWPTPEKDELMSYFLEKIRSKNTFGFIVFLNTIPIGYIQYYYLDRTKDEAGALWPALPDTTVGIDQFIGDPEYLHKGYGTAFIKQFIAELSTLEQNITTIVLDTNPENKAALKCYEKVGFVPIYRYTHQWGESILMKYDLADIR